MDLFVWVKGIKPHVQKWENDLLAQWCNQYKDGKQTGNSTQLSVEPISLYTIRFPKEELTRVLAMSGIDPDGSYLLNRYSILNRLTKLFRKIMKLKPIPKGWKMNPHLAPHVLYKSVAVTPIGLKDEQVIDGKELL